MTSRDDGTTAGERPAATRIAAPALGVLASISIHGAVFAAVLLWSDPNPGAISVPSEAVSLALQRSDVLEAVDVSETLDAAASLASVHTHEGADHDAAAAAEPVPSDELTPVEPQEQLAARDAPPAAAAESAPEGIAVLEGRLETEDAAGQEASGEQPERNEAAQPERKRPRPAETAKRPDPAPQKKAKAAPSRKGGTKSKAAKGSAASSGRVSASTGSAINYAAMVRTRVAARRPAGGGRRGTVVVSFGVSRSGGLAYARIGRSSGDAALDRGVLAAVRGAAPFPKPPPGANLQFSIPFYFR